MLSVIVPLACYAWTSGTSTYWLDAGEFNATAVALGIPHPPGHPLTPLFGKALSLLPLGSLAMRIAFGQALCAAFGAGFLYLAVRRSFALSAGSDGFTQAAVALGVSWSVALCRGYWFQAVRTEVYALQVLLLCVAMERLVACAQSSPRDRPAALSSAALVFGLGLANNHLMAVVALPAALPLLWERVASRGPRALVAPTLAGLIGLGTYAYLPIRAMVGAPIALGNPQTLENLAWVISARVYARESGPGGSEPLLNRFLDALLLVHENMHLLVILVSIGGAYVWLRAPHTRRLGAMLLLWGMGAFVARPFVGPVRSNPDVLGYMVPAFASCAWAAGAFVHQLLIMLDGPSALRRFHRWLCLAPVLLAAVYQVQRARPHVDLSEFGATDQFDDGRLRAVPARAVVVASLPQSVFRAWELEVIERIRPDVALLPLPFLRYPGTLDSLTRRHPELVDAARGYLATGELDPRTLAGLAAQRPLVVELDPYLATYLGRHLLPQGLGYRWQSTPPEPIRVRTAMVERRITLATLRRRVAADLDDQETARQLLGIHYTDAVYHALADRRDAALDSLASARTLFPEDALLRDFGAAIEQTPPGGRIDVQPYLFAPP